MSSFRPRGAHAVLDACGIPFETLNDTRRLHEALVEAAQEAGATVLESCRHRFCPDGVTIVLLLAESHASIHTYPEHGVLLADAFTCGPVDPRELLDSLCNRLDIVEKRILVVERGFAPTEV